MTMTFLIGYGTGAVSALILWGFTLLLGIGSDADDYMGELRRDEL